MKYYLLIFLFSHALYAAKNSFVSFDNGQVQIGQSYLNLSTDNFKIDIKNPTKNIRAYFLTDSLKWVRTKGNVVTPQAELRVEIITETPSSPFLKYNGIHYIPTVTQNSHYLFSLSVELFKRNKIEIFNSNNHKSLLEINAVSTSNVKSHYIDSSCTPYKIDIKNFSQQYLSLYCSLEKLGSLGNEYPKLKVFWITPNYTIDKDRSHAVYLTTFTHSSRSTITLKNNHGERRQLTITAVLPKKLHRIKTALGVGAYKFRTRSQRDVAVNDLVADLTLYGKIDINQKSSFRFFDSFAKKGGSLFNNFGFYFAYDLARIYNDNIQIVALLGIQHITYQYKKDYKKQFQYIAPQGAEITYRHPFGIKNYLLGGGIFLSTNDTITYTNSWIRFGKKIMVEVNYIDWGYGQEYAQTYGLSVVFPLSSFF